MWTFDANLYMKSVLAPALEGFREDGRLPDLFERYGLDLEVKNKEEIEKAIQTTTAFWNKTRLSNKRYESLIVALLNEAGHRNRDALRELTDEEGRAARRAQIEGERLKRREARFAELRSSVGVVAVKGFITPAEEAELLSRFQAAGFTAAEIKIHIRVPVREGAQKLPTESEMSQVLRNRIRNSLGVLKQRDLYEFLGLGPTATPSEIRERHRRLSAEWSQRPSDFYKSAANELLGLVELHCFDGMAKYEGARIFDILDRLRPEVRLAAIDKRISREEFNYLHSLATSQGLDKTLASDFILALAEKFGAAVEWAAGEEMIRCASCSADRPKREEKCTICGADLWTDCPKCNTRTVISVARCGKCGFSVTDVLKVRGLVRKAQLAVEDGAVGAALKHAREAERLWGRQGDVAAVLSRIETRRKLIDEIRRRLDEALVAKKLIAARQVAAELIRTAPDYTGSDGKTNEQLRDEIEKQVARLETTLCRAREHEKTRREDDTVFAYLEALGIAVDSEEARNGLRRHPPAPPANVRASVHQNHVLVEWNASPAVGNLEYVVVRREGRAPAAPDDGELVTLSTSLSCRDEGARPGSQTFYAVFSDRGGTASQAAVSKGLLVAREISNFKLEAGDGVVRGAWDFDLSEGRVRAYCREGAVPDRERGREIALTGSHSFSDPLVVNGLLYYYRVLVEYRDARGQVVFTPGVVQSVKPELPPKPIEHLVVTFDEGVLNLVWSPPGHGKVSVYRAEQAPAWQSGTQITLADLAGLGTRLRPKSDGQAVDPSPPNKPEYYIPVTTAGDVAVVGKARRFVALPDVSHTVAEDFGHYLQLRWQWPADCQTALVAWRPDVFPQDALDPLAAAHKISRGEYELQGGFRVETPTRTAYKFVVFAAIETGGEAVYSAGVRPGARAEIRPQPVPVHYTVNRRRLHRSSFTLTLSSNERVAQFPELIVIAKRGDLQPLRSDDGTLVATLDVTSITPGQTVSLQFELNGVQRPVYMRAFFLDAASYERFRLIDPPPDQLRVK